MKNELEWKNIYYKEEVNNRYTGYVNETWEAVYRGRILIRHVYYKINEGDESERIENMTCIGYGITDENN